MFLKRAVDDADVVVQIDNSSFSSRVAFVIGWYIGDSDYRF